jgi:hypothetical protein
MTIRSILIGTTCLFLITLFGCKDKQSIPKITPIENVVYEGYIWMEDGSYFNRTEERWGTRSYLVISDKILGEFRFITTRTYRSGTVVYIQVVNGKYTLSINGRQYVPMIRKQIRRADSNG